MHASKGILNLPTSNLHLCSPFQQNRWVRIHQFTSFPNNWVKIHHREDSPSWFVFSNKENIKKIKWTFVQDSPCFKYYQVKIHQSRNLYTSRFDVAMASNLWRSLRRGSSRCSLSAEYILSFICVHVCTHIFKTV